MSAEVPKTFVAVDAGDGKTVHGYYSLSSASIEYAQVLEIVTRGLGATMSAPTG